MNTSDFIIIYLACGTPFGMHHFINRRKSNLHWLNSLFVFFVWIPYAICFLREKTRKKTVISKLLKSEAFENELLIENSKKDLERILRENATNFSSFEFRETVERYIGLTMANKNADQNPTEKEKELPRISGSENKILAAKCLHRRNQKLLNFHHNLARRDFLKLVMSYSNGFRDAEKLCFSLIEFVKILGDGEAENVLKNNFKNISQSAKDNAVTHLEKETWSPETHKQPLAKPLTSHLKVMTAPATNSPYKD